MLSSSYFPYIILSPLFQADSYALDSLCQGSFVANSLKPKVALSIFCKSQDLSRYYVRNANGEGERQPEREVINYTS